MTLAGRKVFVFGRLRGLTARRLDNLVREAGFQVTRKPAAADAIALAHSSAANAVADAGELQPPFRRKADARFVSEQTLRSTIGLSAPAPCGEGNYSDEQIAALSGLSAAQVRTLSLYDVLRADRERFSYRDVVVARAVRRLSGAGAKFSKIIWASNTLEQHGRSLSEVRLAESPWGAIVQVLEGTLAEIDGQFLLPLEEKWVDAQDVLARAETCENQGNLQEACRLYELAQRLDREDAVIPFNRGNVLADLGRLLESELAYRQALARDPELADAWYNLGVLMEKTGRTEDALSAYEKAASVEPGYGDALHNAAVLLMRNRMYARAIPILDRLVALSPGSVEWKRLAHLCRLELRRLSERA